MRRGSPNTARRLRRVVTAPAGKPRLQPREITQPELIWPGKYGEDGALVESPRVCLPLQTVETFGAEAAWRNKLIWGDNLLAMQSLLPEYAGKIDLVYIDPPFATGTDFSFGRQLAYRDTWKPNPYLTMMAERLRLIRELLSPGGSLFLHCDRHVGHLLRTIGDEVFDAENFLNEIVWYYYNKFQGNVKRFACNHDVVFWWRKSAAYQFRPQLEKRAEGKVRQLARQWDKEKGSIVNAKDVDGRVMYRETDERTVDDVWRLPMLQPADRTENCGFPTQKPEALLRRILLSASSEGDLVADFFCGSGTLPAVAEKVHRRWIACDLGRWGIHTTRKRVLGIHPRTSFEVLSLGRSEARHWYGMAFPQGHEDYVAFILKLYGAWSACGLAHIHGKKGNALVHVGGVNAPITAQEIAAAVNECAQLKQEELHVLGWDWETTCRDKIAGKEGIKLRLLQIPAEVMEKQAAQKGDVRFFPLACLHAEIKQAGDLAAQVVLTNFTIPHIDPVDERKSWSDYIDYWAVDWDFRNHVFQQGWAAWRTRKDGTLPLASCPHTYEDFDRRSVLVRVIDVFGNETRRALEFEGKRWRVEALLAAEEASVT
jgi:adenine-specific DNA-methyltransferase